MRYDAETRTFHVGARAWPVMEAALRDQELPSGMAAMRTRQVIVRFETGYEASIIWSDLSYSSNHDCRFGTTTGLYPPFTEEPASVEVAIFDRDNNIVGDDVWGYLDSDALNVLLDSLGRGDVKVQRWPDP